MDAKNPQCDLPLVAAVLPVIKTLPFFLDNILGKVSLTRCNRAVVFTLKLSSKSSGFNFNILPLDALGALVLQHLQDLNYFLFSLRFF